MNLSLRLKLLTLSQRALIALADAQPTNGDKWITTEGGSRVLLDKDGNIKGGMGGKFTGQNIKDTGGTKKFTKYATNAEREQAKQPTEAKPSRENEPPKKPTPTPKSKPSNPHDAAKVDISSREKEALQNYTGAMYRDMNPKLRAGKAVSKEDKEDLAHLDAVFSKAKTTEPMTVFRGIGSDFADTLTKGGSFSEGAFMSTSSDKKTASVFTGSGRDRTIMEINVPTGSSAISANDFSQFGSKGGKGENEIILNRGQKYKVVDIKEATRTMPRRVLVELDNEQAKQPPQPTAEREQAKQPTEAKPSRENKSSNSLTMRDNPAKLSSTSQVEAANGDKTMKTQLTKLQAIKELESLKALNDGKEYAATLDPWTKGSKKWRVGLKTDNQKEIDKQNKNSNKKITDFIKDYDIKKDVH
jgi:hypothetical protein